jgi:cytosine/adenosine deaminase-related metal-dependent hydrolase
MKRRHFLQGVGLAGIAAATPLRALGSGLDPNKAPRGTRILLRNGYVITVDKALGELRGDVLIDDGKIAAVGKGLPAGSAEVIDASDMLVVPGFIETHRHTWQSCLRHMGADWSAAQYFANNFFKFGVSFRPEDVYAANLIGRLAALDGGITTLVDWSHIMNSPEHADAAVQALRDAGARSVFAMGWPQAPSPGRWIASSAGKSTADIPDDIRRVRRQHFSANTGLVTLAMAGRGPDFAVIGQVGRDLGIARELDIRTTIHVGFAVAGGIAAMKQANLLGPDITHVHVRDSTEDELQMLADSGGTVSVSPLDEMLRVRWRRGLPPIVRTITRGLVVSLSCDSETTSAGDMFSIMRTTVSVGRIEASNPPDGRPEPANWNAATVVSTRKVLEMATLEGARTTGLERVTGSITVGKDADLMLVKADHLNYYPLNDAVGALVGAADTASIDSVFVAGRPVKFGGRLLDEKLVARARRLATESRDYLFQKGSYPLPENLKKGS